MKHLECPDASTGLGAGIIVGIAIGSIGLIGMVYKLIKFKLK